MTSQIPGPRTGKALFRQRGPGESGGDFLGAQPQAVRHGGYGNDVFRTERPTERSLHINGNAVQPQPEQPFVLARRYDIGRTVIHLASRGGKEDQFLPYGTGFAREDRDNRR